ncbi:MAG: hypothetical protein WA921_04495 [Ahrensia sp.]
MKNTVHIIENHDFGSADAGETHLRHQGYNVHIHKVWKDAPMPKLDGNTAGVMVLGGPQMVSEHEKWPHMAAEFRFVETVIQQQVPLIGICLGAQVIAHVLGASVRYAPDGQQLMGYYKTKPVDPKSHLFGQEMYVLNGNAQGFDVPKTAKLLAYSDETTHPNQAFTYGDTVIALQFHPEVTRDILNHWQTDYAYLLGRPGTQTIAQQDAGFVQYDGAIKAWYLDLLGKLIQPLA